MRILYHHRTRGTDAQRVHILEMVYAFREIGHQVILASLVATGDNNPERESTEAGWKTLARKIPFAYEALQLGYNLFGIPWLIYQILANRIDFIYERYSLFCFCGVFAAWVTRRPIVLEVNSPFALEQSRERDIRAVKFANWMERVICNAAAKVIVVSSPLRRILVANGINPQNIELMPNGINPGHLASAAAPEEVRARHGIAPGQIVVGFVGWFKQWHGIEFLIDAFSTTNLSSSGAVLLLVGDGPAMESLRELVAHHNMQDQVRFTGPVLHENIPEYLHAIDIAVQPAANEYCCPMKIIEYMGVSKPILAPRQENICEILPQSAACFFTPGNLDDFADGLLSLIRSEPLRRELGLQGNAVLWSRGMLWTKNAGAVAALVMRPLDGKAAPSSATRY